MANGEDSITLTRDDLALLRPSAAVFAEGMRLYKDSIAAEESSRSAQERIVMGAFGAWIRKRWKHVTGVVTVVATLAGGVVATWGWVQAKAEEQVLERQATDNQSKAVQDNTAAVGELTQEQAELSKNVGKLKTEVESTAEINQVILQLQLRDPKTKRAIRADKDLKAKVESVSGIKIE